MALLDLQEDRAVREIDTFLKAHGETFRMKGEFEEQVKGQPQPAEQEVNGEHLYMCDCLFLLYL